MVSGYCQNLRCEKQSIGSIKPKCLSKPKSIWIIADKKWLRKKTHVGKYWTKLKPNSCDIVMIENMDTSGSFMAIISPWTGLSKTRSSNYTQLWNKRWLTNLLRCLCLLLQHPRRDGPDRVDIHMRLAIVYCEAEKGSCWTLNQNHLKKEADIIW